MSILDTIKKRYSVRQYKNTPVEQEKVDAILEAAHCAPTAANMQPQKVLVVRKPENLAKFSSGANTYNAPLVMLVCSDLNEAWVRPYDGKNMVDIDASIITDHMMLTATELGWELAGLLILILKQFEQRLNCRKILFRSIFLQLDMQQINHSHRIDIQKPERR